MSSEAYRRFGAIIDRSHTATCQKLSVLLRQEYFGRLAKELTWNELDNLIKDLDFQLGRPGTMPVPNIDSRKITPVPDDSLIKDDDAGLDIEVEMP